MVNEHHLLKQATRGEQSALESLLQIHLQSIYTACYRVCLDEQDAHDISQNVLLKIMKHISSFSGKSSFKTWYYRIAYNESINFLKKKNKLQTESDQIIESIAIEDDVGQQIDRESRNTDITAAINSLPLIERNIILSFYYDELKIREIAEIMELNENTIKTKLSRSKKYLSTHLKTYENHHSTTI